MKKTIASAILFLIMFLIIVYLHINLNDTCDKIVFKSDTLETQILDNSWNSSYSECIDLLNFIEDSYSSLAVYVNHTEVDNLKTETVKLSEYIKCEERAEALASIHYIKFTAKTISEMHEVNIGNIF